MARTDWYRLDNIGRFYSAQAGSSGQTVFRISTEMTRNVDPFALQIALNKTVKRYPGFNVSLKTGFFWHYLEPSGKDPEVHAENLPICSDLHADSKSVLFRVSYYETRINLEVSHMMSDGRGAFRFFTDLLTYYVAEITNRPASLKSPLDNIAERTEDSFRKNYDHSAARSTPSERAYQLPGPRRRYDPLYIEYHLPANEVVAWSKEIGTSVTALLIAAVICAICDIRAHGKSKLPIRMDVPVDLRRFFDSTTMRNFFGLAFVSYMPKDEDETIAEVAKAVQSQIAEGCTEDAIKGRMMRMVSLERNPILRWAPVLLKDIALDLATRITNREVTTSVSSLGKIAFDEDIAQHMRSVNILTTASGLNFTACTFKDDLSIGISTVLLHPDVIRNFCRIFSEHGIKGRINCNLDEEDAMRRIRESRLTGGVR